MPASFEELDYRVTPLGALSLRRRRHPALDVDVFEIKLGEEFLMSSLFTVSETALATLGLAETVATGPLDIVVGGLGLGYTARAVLASEAVASLLVVEALDAVIEWHESGLLPLGSGLQADPRCRLVGGDFFALASGDTGFDPATPGRRFDAILVDIDHAPDFWLAPANGAFYQAAGLHRLVRHLKPGGVFGLWSNDASDASFVARLATVFATARAVPVTFRHPVDDRAFTQTVYLARAAE